MVFSKLHNRYIETRQANELSQELKAPSTTNTHIKGLLGSNKSLFFSSIIKSLIQIHFFIFNDKEEAAYFYDDMIKCLDKNHVCFFPSSYKRSIRYEQKDNSGIVLRTELIKKISAGKAPKVIITYPEALIEKVITKKSLKDNTLKLKKGEKISIEFIGNVLDEYKFDLVDFVYEPGQYSIRGGIVDIFSFAEEVPYRIDFFGNEVESIRSFNIETQLSKDHLNEITIIPDIQNLLLVEERESILSFFTKKPTIWIHDLNYVTEKLDEIFRNTSFDDDTYAGKVKKESYLFTSQSFLDTINTHKLIEFGSHSYFKPDKSIKYQSSHQPIFKKKFEILAEDISTKSEDGYCVYILSDSEKQIERLEAIFQEINANVTFQAIHGTLHEGFIDHELKICCYTDHQIFDRYYKYKLPSNFSRTDTFTLKELNSLHTGDYVVHIDHGIGKFGGLQKIENNGKVQEAIRLVYRDDDILFVSIHSLHRISKYKAKDGIPPKIYKLGTGAWQKLKQNTKKKVKDIARDLIALYAKRKEQKGFEFSPDTYLQDELEASFIYEDTPDQLKATWEVKEDMESGVPMDRLVCGDVGFGKTEIAIRAAFKAVTDNKQVAVLVPTTILALQHYYTFSERLKDFPCTVKYISRLKKPKEQKKIIVDLIKGKVDILIGTHRLIGQDIKFKDLGLLIIDEEQKFGVSAKEKLKQIKLNVDTLTLTATPIPRTLQFSLMGARDLSIIKTPPSNRYPIITELHTFNEEIIKEAIDYEISRNGQIFFIHNRIQNITEVEVLVKRICPQAKTIVAHGQMEGKKLETIMLDYINGLYDVLIATTIIESGLDIPNANTILINDAQNFGLSDLHQLRGRVGRSNKKAFCYLLAPPLTTVTSEARRRLKAIEEFSDLGSGFNIALQDLDIRGAGNMLGAEQSGFIADIGFETYNRILNEAIQELKEEEFKEVFSGKTPDSPSEPKFQFLTDCIVDTDMELLFPDDYVSNISERINLYKELDGIENIEQLEMFKHQINDRFGPIPTTTQELLHVVHLRWLAISLGFEKVILKNNIMINHFISNSQSAYYKSSQFNNILQFIQNRSKHYKIKEDKDKLTLIISNVSTISQSIQELKTIENNIKP